MQSTLKNENKELLRMIAADLYTAHPRFILMYVVKKLCNKLNIENIEGVSNSHHIWKYFFYKSKNKLVGTDYDLFWKSIGGRKLDNGNFQIPVEICFKPLEMYRQKKRNLIIKKLEMLNKFEIILL